MPLERIDEQAAREEFGYSFQMRIVGSVQTLRVVVSDDALVARALVLDEAALRNRLEAERAELEAVAREKFCQGRVSTAGEILITASDVLSIIE